jgi:hypothetical protein
MNRNRNGNHHFDWSSLANPGLLIQASGLIVGLAYYRNDNILPVTLVLLFCYPSLGPHFPQPTGHAVKVFHAVQYHCASLSEIASLVPSCDTYNKMSQLRGAASS